jgi:hypothetical protein
LLARCVATNSPTIDLHRAGSRERHDQPMVTGVVTLCSLVCGYQRFVET